MSSSHSELSVESTSKLQSTSRFAGQRVHFIGIGGCGMAGLAKMLLDSGAIVTGSDTTPNPQTIELTQLGAKISRNQIGELINSGVNLVVRTAAVPDSNPEYKVALRYKLPVIKYAQLLGQVMSERMGIAICGTHGKSTTTAMTAYVLTQTGLDPSFVVGGTSSQLKGSSHSGGGSPFVVEACEYVRSFHYLRPTVACILNIEADHLDCYKDLDDIISAFHVFGNLTPANGCIIANGQDANVRKALADVDRKILWVGLNAPAGSLEWNAIGAPGASGCYAGEIQHNGQTVARVSLSIPGAHNLYNACVAIAASVVAGADPAKAGEAVSKFKGVDRRMTLVGSYNGATVVDDYGHHPTEIRATLKALRERYNPKRLLCIFQPHQHSRTRTLMDEFATCFAEADLSIIPDIYSVRDSEEEKRLTSSQDLVDRINLARGMQLAGGAGLANGAVTAGGEFTGAKAMHIATFSETLAYLKKSVKPGDLVLTIGAGNVCDIARDLVDGD